jgi:GMP synthase (glutamine-hydrolysing)
MDIQEITEDQLNTEQFIKKSIEEISSSVGDGTVINALSGGVDSSTVTLLGQKALGDRLKTVFIDNGIMREGEPERVVSTFGDMGIPVELIDARQDFFNALKGVTDPEKKREAITQTFYRVILANLVEKTGAKHILHGTIYTDVEETIAGIKRQHNILEQIGIDTEKEFGYSVLEPLVQLRKPAVRKLARALGLPEEISNRPPFPGPALAARIIGEVKGLS